MATLLSQGLRVLELDDEKGYFCGKIFGTLGADVIKIERVGGDVARNYPPFYQGKPDPERSLYWYALNVNKRGITLDVEKARGRELFQELVKKADILIETNPPGHLDKLGIGYEALNQLNPKLIMVSITPFGQTGPYKDLKGCDLVDMALSGIVSFIGEPGERPLSFPLDQAYNFTNIQAAAAALMAHYYRKKSGEGGQWVDMSVFDCMVRNVYRAPYVYKFENTIMPRTGHEGLARSLDGWVTGGFRGGPVGVRDGRPIYEWLKAEGKSGILDEIDWEGGWSAMDWDKRAGEAKVKAYQKVVRDFLATQPKDEVDKQSEARRFMMTPLIDIAEVVRHPQFESRGFWTKVRHPELGETFTYPGQFFISSETEQGVYRRAPLIGEHNREIYRKELGLSAAQLASLKRSKVI